MVQRPANIYAFLTTEPNAELKLVHPKAMPVILTTVEEYDTWMRALGRSQGAAATASGRRAADRRDRREVRPAAHIEFRTADGTRGQAGASAFRNP